LSVALLLVASLAAVAGPARADGQRSNGARDTTRAVTSLSLLATPEVVDYGGSAVLSGHLAEGGAGGALTVTFSIDGVTWAAAAAGALTDSNGDVALVVTPVAAHGATIFLVAFAGDSSFDPVEAQIVVGSRAALDTPVAPRTVGRSSPFTVTGLLRPRHSEGTTPVTIDCFRLESGVWVLRASFMATVGDEEGEGDASRYSARVRLPSTGTWRLTASHADAAHAPSISPPSTRMKVTAGPDAPIWDRDGVTTIPEKMSSRLNARQLIVITGSGLGLRTGKLRVYEYRAGDWIRTMDVSTRWGENGLVNGLTRHAGTRTTPTGIWRLPGYAFGTNVRAPQGAKLNWRHITQRSWWSSEHNSTYNTWVETSRYVYGEHLADYPGPYEFAVSSGYNALPNTRVYGRGSAIFLHVVHPGYSAGCVMLSRANTIRLLRQIDPGRRPACAIGTLKSGTKTCIYGY
jgi:L,D-peptidoglycan transpeptidase YkuD (ErfK/YbiS/YcfS/YnhG family)